MILPDLDKFAWYGIDNDSYSHVPNKSKRIDKNKRIDTFDSDMRVVDVAKPVEGN